MRPRLSAVASLLFASIWCAWGQQPTGSERAHQLSGTIVDTAGGVIANATVVVQSANGTVVTTIQSDTNGSFIVSGLSAGDFRLVVSHANFETREVPSP